MKTGEERFIKYIIQLEALLAQASVEKDPGKWLYENDARTCLFMLEALSRLYAKVHNKKKFEKINKWTKEAEDLLGAVDYYDGFRKLFAVNTITPVTVTSWCNEAMAKNLAKFNTLLREKKWIGEKAKRTKKIRKLLKKSDWLSQKKDTEALAKVFKGEIEEIIMYNAELDNGFTELEGQVHEMRRKLRWLSIYAKATNGLFQLTDSALMTDGKINTYLTEEIVNSPFNQMADPGNNEYIILLERNYFLALSWVISAFGKLKDNGLEIFALTEALQETENISSTQANHVALQLLHVPENHLQEILDQASEIMKNFIAGSYLKNMVVGVSLSQG